LWKAGCKASTCTKKDYATETNAAEKTLIN